MSIINVCDWRIIMITVHRFVGDTQYNSDDFKKLIFNRPITSEIISTVNRRVNGEEGISSSEPYVTKEVETS